MARFAVGALLLLTTSCGAAPAPPSAPVAACTFGDLRTCAARCERGSAASCNAAGAHYELGSGVARDVDAAAKYYARACSAGVASGCENEGRVRATKAAASVEAAPEPASNGNGTSASTGGLLGTWSATTASGCTSGASQSAVGSLAWAQFGDAERGGDHALLVQSQSNQVFGVHVQRGRPFRSVDIYREDCPRFDAELRLQPDGSLAADVELDCTVSDGGRLTASIHSAICRGG